MKKYFFSTMIVLLGLSSVGCKKFLDIKSDNKLVVPQTLNDIQGLLDDADKMNLRTTPSYGEASADDYFLMPTSLAPLGVNGRELYLWQPIPYRFQNDWSVGYLAIYNTNLALDMLNDIEKNTVNSTMWNNVKGSALFYRAFYELLLLGQFGLAYDDQTSESDLGIVLRRSSDFNIPSVRSSVAECYRAILTDLEASLSYLPNYPQHVMRPSKLAAHALLARTHLYMRNYNASLASAEAALALKSILMDYNNDVDIYSLNVAVPFKPLNKEIIFYTEMFGGFGLQAPTRASVNADLYASYRNDDLRKTGFFLASGVNQRFKGSYTSHASALFSGLAVDELYLTQAECLAYINKEEQGMDVLNKFLKMRWRNTIAYVPLMAIDKSEALNQIRIERRKSLLMRGLRWMDIKRQNKEGADINLTRTVDGISYTLPPNSAKYALPLPTDIIEQTGMPQN